MEGDREKSRVTGTIDSVRAAGAKTWTFRYGTFTYTLRADGTEQSTPFGKTVMEIVNPTTWRFTNNNDGKNSEIETWALSADGNSMTRTFSGKKEDGEPFSGVITLKRIGGKSGFEGTWESEEAKLSFTEVDIEPNGEDGITLLLPEDGTRASLKFGGKDYPESGPRLPPGMTISAKLVGPRKAKATTKLGEKIFDHEQWEVSKDGKTFIYTERDIGATKPLVVILHRIDAH